MIDTKSTLLSIVNLSPLWYDIVVIFDIESYRGIKSPHQHQLPHIEIDAKCDQTSSSTGRESRPPPMSTKLTGKASVCFKNMPVEPGVDLEFRSETG